MATTRTRARRSARVLRVPCSQCMSDLRVDLNTLTVHAQIPASGRGRSHTPAHTITEQAWEEPGLIVWQAPCCEDYIDSLEETFAGDYAPW